MLYRVVQEALTNIARHSAACVVTARVKACAGGIDGRVSDDGAGFPGAVSNHQPDHGLGLTTMWERTRILGGKLEIRSRPGEGTTVHFSIPAARQERET